MKTNQRIKNYLSNTLGIFIFIPCVVVMLVLGVFAYCYEKIFDER